MANRDRSAGRRTGKWNAKPIDAYELHQRICGVFGVTPEPTALDVVRMPFPDPALPDFRERYLVRELLRKYQGFDLGIDRRRAALDSLIACEKENAATNERVSNRDYGDDPRVALAYSLSCRKAISILGRFSWSVFAEGCRFGPGATTDFTRRGGIREKLTTGSLETTRSAMPLLEVLMTKCLPGWACLASDPADGSFTLSEREYDRFETARKNALTDRTILIQPSGSILMQLGYGYHMRLALQRAGIVLYDQSINQQHARRASRSGRDATVDFHNASNSITYSVVHDHLGNHLWKGDGPGEASGIDRRWWLVADALRTTGYVVDGTERTHHLFSAMGNGYTFELESLIFYSLAWATCNVLGLHDAEISIYGDDVILPNEALPLFGRVAAFCGLKFNTNKTHSSDGPYRFRESCGKHYLNGVDVTPIYCSEPLVTVSEIVLLANNLLRWSAGFEPGFGRDGRLQPVYDWVVSHLPKAAHESAIPFGEANDGLIKDFDEAQPAVKLIPKTTLDVTFSCIGGMCSASCTGGWCFGVRKMNLDLMRLGYKARTVELKHRQKRLDGLPAVLEWLYAHSYKRVSQPRDPLKWPWSSSDELSELGKATMVNSTRVVPRWTYLGPWVFPD